MVWHVKAARGDESGLRNGRGLHMSEREESLSRGTLPMPAVKPPRRPGPTPEDLLNQILQEQRKTNQLLAMLIDAMSEDGDPDAEPLTYIDGSPRV